MDNESLANSRKLDKSIRPSITASSVLLDAQNGSTRRGTQRREFEAGSSGRRVGRTANLLKALEPAANSPLEILLFSSPEAEARLKASSPKYSFDSNDVVSLETFASRNGRTGHNTNRDVAFEETKKCLCTNLRHSLMRRLSISCRYSRSERLRGLEYAAQPRLRISDRSRLCWSGHGTSVAAGVNRPQAASRSWVGVCESLPSKASDRMWPSSVTSSNRTDTRLETPDSCMVTP